MKKYRFIDEVKNTTFILTEKDDMYRIFEDGKWTPLIGIIYSPIFIFHSVCGYSYEEI